jgi:lactoylglutathione lyase family protein
MNVSPKTFSHIGLSVPDLEAAVKFYTEVLGLYTIMEPTEVFEDDSPNWKSLKIVHLATADRVGIEIFEFPGNYAPEDNLAHKRHGTFHFCVQDPDVEGLVEKIVAAGGKQRMPIREYYPGEKPYRMCYVEDPFGIVFEIYSHSYELTYSEGAYS